VDVFFKIPQTYAIIGLHATEVRFENNCGFLFL